jgi:cell division protein FtsB
MMTLSFIVSQKLKDQYETIYFSIDIWNYYIFNHFQLDFLTFLEKKLYEQALNTKELLDCLTYSSHFRSRSFLSMLEIINFNFDKFLNIFRYENKSVNIESYVTQNVQTDVLSKIYEQVKIFIEKEKYNSFCLIKFNVTLWMPYSQCENLDTLKFIRKIIMECRQMDPELTEDTIQLPKKIHDVGFIYIQKGLLVGENLLQFLGEDEAFYVQRQINDLVMKNINLQNQVNNQGLEINNLKTENHSLKNRVSSLESKVSSLQSQHSNLSSRVDRLDRKVSSLDSEISSVRSDVRSLERRSNF